MQDPVNPPRDYLTMWSLVQRNFNNTLVNDAAFLSVVTPELLMAIFWEETQFHNIRQRARTGRLTHADWLNRVEHAVGFGQVQRGSILRMIKLNPTKLDGLLPRVSGKDINLDTIDLEILADEGKGVQIAWRTLWHLHSTGIRTKQTLVARYGNNPDKATVPPKWIDCETVQVGFQRMPSGPAPKTFRANALLIAGAFWIARGDGDFPRAFFGVTQKEAEGIGTVLRAIVKGKAGVATLSQTVLGELQKFVADVLGKNP